MTATACLDAPAAAGRAVEDRNALVEANLGLAVYAARKWERAYPAAARRLGGFDELLSAAQFGLLNAAARWDEGRGVAFSTYAMRSMRNELWRQAQQSDMIRLPCRLQGAARAEARKRVRPVSVGPADGPDGEGRRHEPAVETDVSLPACRAELRQRVEAALLALPRKLAFVARVRLLRDEPVTLRALGRRLGLSQEGARRLERKAAALLRELLPDPAEGPSGLNAAG